MGPRLLAALIEAGNHEDRRVRSWARWGVRENGVRSAGDAVQQRDNAILADVLRAYGTVRDFEAMRVVVSLVTSERAQVREAARWATEQYGRNAVWQLREKYKNLTGNEAERSWGWRAVADALYRTNDDSRLAPVRADLEAGLAAQQQGDLAAMEQKFDAVLARAPTLQRRAEMAPGYAALGRARLQERDARGAARALRRAVWLAPDGEVRNAARADLAFVEAELTRAAGIVDLSRYREAVALAPEQQHERASAILERVAPEAAPPSVSSDRRRWAIAAAGIALALIAVALLRPRRRKSAPAGLPADEITDPELSAPTTDPGLAPPAISDDAPDTLPG
jgi:hypothetical protein